MALGFTLTSWKDDILGNLFTFAWQDKTQFNGHATVFWILIVALIAVVWAGHWAKDLDSKRTTTEVKGILDGMHAQSNKLTDAVTQLHSLPPRGVLEVCKKGYDLCEGYFNLANSVDLQAASASAELEGLVRKILLVMEKFVRTFDGEHLDGTRIRYGLNVMLYVPRADYESVPLKQQFMDRLHFKVADTSINSAVGVLDIVPTMSVATGAPGGDAELEHFALPINFDPVLAERGQDRRPALPGASNTFVNMIHSAVPSIEFLSQTMDKENTNPHAKQAVLNYFKQPKISKTVQSFICVPLIADATGMVGVLNIHRDAPNPTIEDKLALLVPLMTPYRHQLARLMSKYKPLYLKSALAALPTRGQP